MKDPQELVLEAALREVHRCGEDAPDLAEQIAAAWQRGERGSGVDGLALPGPKVAQAAVRASAHRSRWRVAAAALALVSGTLAVRALVPSAPETTAVAEAGSAPDTLAEPIHVRGDAAFDVELPQGGRVQGRSAVLAIETGHVRLELGSVDLSAPPGLPLMLSSAAGSIIFAPGARAMVRIDLDVPLAQVDSLAELSVDARARELTVGGTAYPRWMTFELTEGSAWIVNPTGSEASAIALPGGRYILSEGGTVSGLLDDTTRTRGRELVARLLGTGGSPWSSLPHGMDAGDESARWDVALGAFLDRYPHYWPALRMSVRAAFQAPGENMNGCVRTVRFLAAQPSEPALALVRELWLLAPDLYGYEQKVVLAERGAFEFEREIRAIVDADPSGEPSSRVLPAAHLALQGDAKGRAQLRRFLVLPFTHRSNVFETLIAARCLAIGGEPEVWTSTRTELIAQIGAGMKRGWRDRAALHAAAIEFFDSRWFELDQDRLGATLQELDDHCRKRVKQLGAAGALEALLTELENRD